MGNNFSPYNRINYSLLGYDVDRLDSWKMSLRIRDLTTVPPESWTYHIDEINLDVSTRNYTILYPTIIRRCLDNNIQPPTEQEVIDQMCDRLHVSCYDDQTREPLINKMGLPFVAPNSGCCNPRTVVDEILI